jgi:hypothetical protein
MKHIGFVSLSAFLLLTLPTAHSGAADQELTLSPKAAGSATSALAMPAEKKYPDFSKVTQGAKEYDGLFKLYHKDDHLYMEIASHQFDRPFLLPMAIARGMGYGGRTLNFDEQWVVLFRHVGDKVYLVRRNIHFKAKPNTPLAKAVETTYTDSVLQAVRIATVSPRQGVVISLNDIFMTNLAQLPFGVLDPNRSTWHKVKAFKHNIEIELAATFTGRGLNGGSVIDPRGSTVILHFGLAELPDAGYQPRFADDRVGYFLSVVKDFSSNDKDTSFLRYVKRWRLEKVDSSAKLSPPKKKIVFWIEKSVPDEYRTYVREGILEWNKAFEKIGFRDAIEVRQQTEQDEDFDPEDINYNTFRWVANGERSAMGPSRANPLTGEILDADIIFDADMIRAWRQQYNLGAAGGSSALSAMGIQEPLSAIQAGRLGWGLLDPLLLRQIKQQGWNTRRAPSGAVAEQGEPNPDLLERFAALQQGSCQCGAHRRQDIGLAAMTLTARGAIKPGDKVPEELIGQAIKETVMHEVGHTLGLRHNFKGSTMLKNEQLHDTTLTHKQGLVGSVMDYNPINLAPKGVKQGDYFTTTLGPYDYWAIEYAYKPLSGGTEGELDKLKEIAHRGALSGHDYATDEDLYNDADPLVNMWDLGADPMKFAQDRLQLTKELFDNLADRVVDKGEGYQRVRQAFGMLLGQYADAAELMTRYVGGEYMHRDHRGDPSGRDPFVPVPSAKQRQALQFLQEHFLTDQAFQFSPELLRKLAADRWMHWGNERVLYTDVEYPLHERVLQIQQIVLDHLFDSDVLARIQNNSLKCAKDEEPLTIAEVFRCLTDGIWREFPPAAEHKEGKEKNHRITTSIVRRNLQREHLKKLIRLVLGEKSPESSGNFLIILFGGGSATAVPSDARSLARMHLRDINRRIEATLSNRQTVVDDTTRAHLEACQERIAKVLNASVQINEP